MINKFLLLACFLFIGGQHCTAQNYKLFQEDSLRLYSIGNGTVYPLFFDSAASQGLDTMYFNYGIVGNVNGCIVIDRPIFIGKKVLRKSDGTTVLFNSTEDSIFIKTNAIPGDSWAMYNFSNGNKVMAYMSLTYTYSIFNVMDSVKTIVMNVINANGISIASPLNNETIKISKNYGIYVGTDFNYFPDAYIEFTLLSKRMMTKGDYYRFSPGDTIQTWQQCEMGGVLGPYTYSTTTVCDVYYSSGGDTMFYKNRCNQGYSFITDLNEPIVQGKPGRLINNDCHYYDLVLGGGGCIPTALCVMENSYSGIFVGADSCYYELFEPEADTYIYLEGTGTMLTFHSDGSGSTSSVSCSEGIKYYRHDQLRCGRFIDLTLDLPEIAFLNYADMIQVAPNPVIDFIQFSRTKSSVTKKEIRIEIFDIAGKFLFARNFLQSDEKLEIDISQISKGVYFYSAKSDDNHFQNGKILKVQ